MENKLNQEIEHGIKIAPDAEHIWGWGTPAGRVRAERRAGYYLNLGAITAGTEVLEIGCGTGIFTEKIAAAGAALTAIDISPELLAKASGNPANLGVRFKAENAERMSFADNSFDTVFGSSILHHLNLIPALREIKRVLRTGGRLVFTEPNMLNPQILLAKNIKPIGKILGDTPSETAFIRWPLARALRGLGFNAITVVPFDFLHPWTPRPLIPFVSGLGRLLEHTPGLREIAGSLLISAYK